jgi:two-component system response regulator HydG
MRRVLIADDDVFLREALQEALRAEGFEVQVVGGVEDACLKVLREDFDVVISDIRMPGDGATLPRRMREVRPRTPVILVTGFDEPGVRERALAEGALDYIVKPIRLNRLRDSLERAFRQRSRAADGGPEED